jgi:hypothetical protein
MNIPNYGGMFGKQPSALLPNGQQSLSGTRQLMEIAAAYGRGGGPGKSKSVIGEYDIPRDAEIIYGKIREDEGSGSGVTFVTGTGDAGFYDADGYLCYAFDEINPFWPWKGELIDGISTVLPSDSGSGLQGGGNFAYPLNADSIGPGALCALIRAGEHWIIIGVSEGGSGSGGSTMTIDCGGVSYPVTISGTTITVGDAL